MPAGTITPAEQVLELDPGVLEGTASFGAVVSFGALAQPALSEDARSAAGPIQWESLALRPARPDVLPPVNSAARSRRDPLAGRRPHLTLSHSRVTLQNLGTLPPELQRVGPLRAEECRNQGVAGPSHKPVTHPPEGKPCHSKANLRPLCKQP